MTMTTTTTTPLDDNEPMRQSEHLKMTNENRPQSLQSADQSHPSLQGAVQSRQSPQLYSSQGEEKKEDTASHTSKTPKQQQHQHQHQHQQQQQQQEEEKKQQSQHHQEEKNQSPQTSQPQPQPQQQQTQQKQQQTQQEEKDEKNDKPQRPQPQPQQQQPQQPKQRRSTRTNRTPPQRFVARPSKQGVGVEEGDAAYIVSTATTTKTTATISNSSSSSDAHGRGKDMVGASGSGSSGGGEMGGSSVIGSKRGGRGRGGGSIGSYRGKEKDEGEKGGSASKDDNDAMEGGDNKDVATGGKDGGKAGTASGASARGGSGSGSAKKRSKRDISPPDRYVARPSKQGLGVEEGDAAYVPISDKVAIAKLIKNVDAKSAKRASDTIGKGTKGAKNAKGGEKVYANDSVASVAKSPAKSTTKKGGGTPGKKIKAIKVKQSVKALTPTKKVGTSSSGVSSSKKEKQKKQQQQQPKDDQKQKQPKRQSRQTHKQHSNLLLQQQDRRSSTSKPSHKVATATQDAHGSVHRSSSSFSHLKRKRSSDTLQRKLSTDTTGNSSASSIGKLDSFPLSFEDNDDDIIIPEGERDDVLVNVDAVLGVSGGGDGGGGGGGGDQNGGGKGKINHGKRDLSEENQSKHSKVGSTEKRQAKANGNSRMSSRMTLRRSTTRGRSRERRPTEKMTALKEDSLAREKKTKGGKSAKKKIVSSGRKQTTMIGKSFTSDKPVGEANKSSDGEGGQEIVSTIGNETSEGDSEDESNLDDIVCCLCKCAVDFSDASFFLPPPGNAVVETQSRGKDVEEMDGVNAVENDDDHLSGVALPVKEVVAPCHDVVRDVNAVVDGVTEHSRTSQNEETGEDESTNNGAEVRSDAAIPPEEDLTVKDKVSSEMEPVEISNDGNGSHGPTMKSDAASRQEDVTMRYDQISPNGMHTANNDGVSPCSEKDSKNAEGATLEEAESDNGTEATDVRAGQFEELQKTDAASETTPIEATVASVFDSNENNPNRFRSGGNDVLTAPDESHGEQNGNESPPSPQFQLPYRFYDPGNAVILCDGPAHAGRRRNSKGETYRCERAYHQRCHFIPVFSLPRGQWRCLICRYRDEEYLKQKKTKGRMGRDHGKDKAGKSIDQKPGGSVAESLTDEELNAIFLCSAQHPADDGTEDAVEFVPSKSSDVSAIELKFERASAPLKAKVLHAELTNRAKAFINTALSNIRVAEHSMRAYTETSKARKLLAERIKNMDGRLPQELVQCVLKIAQAKMKIRDFIMSIYETIKRRPFHGDLTRAKYNDDSDCVDVTSELMIWYLNQQTGEGNNIKTNAYDDDVDAEFLNFLFPEGNMHRRRIEPRTAEANENEYTDASSHASDSSGVSLDDLKCTCCHEGHASHENDLLLCDGENCYRAFHMRCIEPNLTPEDVASDDNDNWFCPLCTAHAVLVHWTQREYLGDEWEDIVKGNTNSTPKSPDKHYTDGDGSDSQNKPDEWETAIDVFPEAASELRVAQKLKDGVDDEETQGYLTDTFGIVTSSQTSGLAYHLEEDEEDEENDEDFILGQKEGKGGSDNDDDSEVDNSSVEEDMNEETKLFNETIDADELDALSVGSASVQSSDDDDSGNESNPNKKPRRSKRKRSTFSGGKGSDSGSDYESGGNAPDRDVGKLDTANIVHGKRNRTKVDYRKLNDALFGDESDEDAKGAAYKLVYRPKVKPQKHGGSDLTDNDENESENEKEDDKKDTKKSHAACNRKSNVNEKAKKSKPPSTDGYNPSATTAKIKKATASASSTPKQKRRTKSQMTAKSSDAKRKKK